MSAKLLKYQMFSICHWGNKSLFPASYGPVEPERDERKEHDLLYIKVAFLSKDSKRVKLLAANGPFNPSDRFCGVNVCTPDAHWHQVVADQSQPDVVHPAQKSGQCSKVAQ